MLRTLASSWTLFFGLLLIMAGNGLQVVLLGTAATEAGFSKVTTGFVMSGYFIGLFLGSMFAPKFLNNVGHVRVFGAMSALASVSVLVAALFVNPPVWLAMRILTGFSFSCMYIVSESWLNDKATNETRGTLLSLYMIVVMGGLGVGQLMISLEDMSGYGLYLLSSAMISIAVVPVLLSVGSAPSFEEPERMKLRRVLQVSPLAVFGLALQGLSVAMLFGMGAVYGVSIGLDNDEVGYFLTAPVLGCLLLQYPLGRLSDRFDRRLVILGSAVVGTVSAALAGLFGRDEILLLLLCMVIYGGVMFPLYSLCMAHANDFLAPRQMVAAASGLIMVNGAGAMFGSPMAALAVEFLGVGSFFVLAAGIQLATVAVTLLRMMSRPSVPNEAQGSFVAIPKTSTAVVAQLNPEAEWTQTDEESGAEESPFHDNPYVNPQPSQDDGRAN